MEKYLVTGGAGFIGSNIVEELVKRGHFVRILDNFSSGKEENLNFALSLRLRGKAEAGSNLSPCHCEPQRGEAISTNFELVRGDIRDYQTCSQACAGIDYVLHQAALRSVPKSMTMPHEYNAVNIDGTVNILEAALKNKIKRVVIASSSSVYGDAVKFPEKEADIPLLISPYALTKLAGEYYSRVFSENYGLETVNLRYFNVFGPKQSLDDEYAVVIPKFITCMLNDEQPPIHGTGKQSRDFTYVDNVVYANILAATTSGIKCEIFNVACGSDNTILSLVDTLNRIMGKQIKPKFGPVRQGDVFRTLADISKIKSILGFKPEINFEEGLKRTLDWFRLDTEKKR
ncbi:MAG: SDR family oxidoreductase [Candidatus Omnitrophota bacterium]